LAFSTEQSKTALLRSAVEKFVEHVEVPDNVRAVLAKETEADE